MRNAFARTIYELAKQDERIIVLVADISPAGAMEDFRREFPARFLNVGVAEASMIGLAAGLAQRGFKPFCYTIATFALFRCYEQIRCDLAYQNLPVTVIGMGAGLSYPTLGGTHQAIEDVAVALACPNLTVLAPCDPAETIDCVYWCAKREGSEGSGPVYVRLGKAGEPDLTMDTEPWAFGRLRWLYGGPAYYHRMDTCVVSYGPAVSIALRVAKELEPQVNNISVACCSTLSEFDVVDLAALARTTRYLVVIEEASGTPLASILHKNSPNVRSFALARDFPHVNCGTREEMLKHCGLTVENILLQIRGEVKDE